MKNDIDIKEKTLEVLRQEELQFNSDNGKMEKIEPFSEAEIYKAMQSQQDGDAWLFYQLFRDQLCYDHAGRKWYRWNTHYWKEDEVEEVIKKIDTVVDIYSKEASKWAWRALKAAKEGDGKGRQDAEKKEKQYLKKISVLQKKQWQKEYREKNKEHYRELGKKYQQEHGRERTRKHYEKHMNERKEQSKKNSRELTKWMDEIKTGMGCAICGYNKYGYALDFHHLNGNKKICGIYTRGKWISLFSYIRRHTRRS